MNSKGLLPFDFDEYLKLETLVLKSYHAHVLISVRYGNYGWCGNSYEGSKSGHYLTNGSSLELQQNKIGIHLKMIVNRPLLIDADHVLVNNFYYTLSENWSEFPEIFFCTNEKTQNLTIQFLKFLPKSEDESPLSRCPTKLIHEIIIEVPRIKISGSMECNLCHRSVNDIENKYISPCNHLFHTSCIFEYLEKNDRLEPEYSYCVNWCKHSKKPKIFNCPVCYEIIEK